MLEQEIAFYNENLNDWLTHYRNRFVLVKGRELVGTFDTMDDTLAEGARRYGLQSFLVRRVEPTQKPVDIPALTLGILRADPSLSDTTRS